MAAAPAVWAQSDQTDTPAADTPNVDQTPNTNQAPAWSGGALAPGWGSRPPLAPQAPAWPLMAGGWLPLAAPWPPAPPSLGPWGLPWGGAPWGLGLPPVLLPWLVAGQRSSTPAARGTPVANNVGQIQSTLRADGDGPCATAIGATCVVEGQVQSGTGTIIGANAASSDHQWRIVVAARAIPAGAVAQVFVSTTNGIEQFACPPAVDGQATTCQGTTPDLGLHGGLIRVFAGNSLVAQGTIRGSDRPSAVAVTKLLILTTGISLFDTSTPFNPYQRTATTFSSTGTSFSNSGILDLLNCSLSTTGSTPLRFCGNGSIAWLPYSYAGVTNGQVNDFTDLQTRQHLALSSAAMDQVYQLARSLAPNASITVIGHSLGGAVGSFWGAANPRVPIVTLDSPVAGMYTFTTSQAATMCINSRGYIEIYNFSSFLCTLASGLAVFSSDAVNDIRQPATVTRMGQANAINFGNMADFVVPSWYALNAQVPKGNVLINFPCTLTADPVNTNHLCILVNQQVSQQVVGIIQNANYPPSTPINRNITLNVTLTNDGQPVSNATITVRQLGTTFNQTITTNNQGQTSITVPWRDTYLQNVFQGFFGPLYCNFGALPAQNTNLTLPMVVGCSPDAG